MKKYIDFDGVIMDTYEPVFGDYLKKQGEGIYINDIDHVKNKDWVKVLKDSKVINNAIKIIKKLDPKETTILTRVQGILCDIVLVPFELKKTDIVSAKGAVLVDDAVFNLDEWVAAGGEAIFFDNYGTNVDGWGKENTKYVRTDSLEILKKY